MGGPRSGSGSTAGASSTGFGAPPAVALPSGAGSAATGLPGASGRAGGGPFGGDTQSLTQAVAYASRHGGGAVAVSSQQGASGEVIAGANVVAIGGFSGRESQVSTTWLADAVQAGRIRFVLAAEGQGGMPGDPRVGSSDVMAAVRRTCTKVSSVTGLYDCQGKAAGLAG